MANTLPPPPIRSWNEMPAPWRQWFYELWQRAGAATGPSTPELAAAASEDVPQADAEVLRELQALGSAPPGWQVAENLILPSAPEWLAPDDVRPVDAYAGELAGGRDTALHTHRNVSLSWEDLRFPAQGINPPGAATDPARNTTTGMLEFSGTANNVIAGIAQMPHGWADGTLVRPHLHLRFPTASTNTSRWLFEYDVASVGGNFANAYGTYTTLATISVTNPNNALQHGIFAFGDLPMTGHTRSACIMWKITRLASTDAADNDTSAVVLLEFDIHYQIGRMGTPEEV